MAFLYKGDATRGAVWRDAFAAARPDIPFLTWPDVPDPSAVRWLAAWTPPPDLARTLPNLEVVFSTGAGVDQLDLSAIPDHVRVVRMVEPGIVEGMVEYVTMAVLALHRHLIDYLGQQRTGAWDPIELVPASRRRIGFLGAGNLAQAAMKPLIAMGFPVAAWSRSPKTIDGVNCWSGPVPPAAFLAETDILVCLLPLTAETHGILCRSLFDGLPPGAGLVNAGRGGHMVQGDLIAALDSGRLSGAVLDVTDPEPLPAADPMRSHPSVIITPHVASMTRAETAAEVLLDNIARLESDRSPVGEVERRRGY